MKVRYRLIPHEWYRHHDVQVTLSLPAGDMLALLGSLNVGLHYLKQPGPDTTPELAAKFTQEQQKVIALMRKIEARRERAAKVPRED